MSEKKVRTRATADDRNRMMAMLDSALSAGALDLPEYEARQTRCLSAVFRDELKGLVSDIPTEARHRPADAAKKTPRARNWRLRPVQAALVLVLAVIVGWTVGGARIALMCTQIWLAGICLAPVFTRVVRAPQRRDDAGAEVPGQTDR